MDDHYPAGTIRDIVKMPPDVRARFLAELPAILDSTAEVIEAVPALVAKAREELPRWLRWLISPAALERSFIRQIDNSVFVDDDKGTIRVSVTLASGRLYEQTEKLGSN